MTTQQANRTDRFFQVLPAIGAAGIGVAMLYGWLVWNAGDWTMKWGCVVMVAAMVFLVPYQCAYLWCVLQLSRRYWLHAAALWFLLMHMTPPVGPSLVYFLALRERRAGIGAPGQRTRLVAEWGLRQPAY